MMVCYFPKSTRVREHERSAHSVRGHFRNMRYGRVWISEHIRSGSLVSEHCRS